MTSAGDTHSHPFGKGVQGLKFDSVEKTAEINGALLDKMFLHPDVKNRKIVIFSIVGAFRRGKSFFLDYCLRYLYANYASIKNPEVKQSGNRFLSSSWIGAANEPLRGFSWRSGVKRDTQGIVFWSDVFLHTISNTGEKIAIVVMDTQGLFDKESSPTDNSRIFAIGTLVSSIQMFNLSGHIQEDHLQYLQFAIEFAKFATADGQPKNNKPFQKFLFLVRDWQNPDEYSFGPEGGDKYLDTVLAMQDGQKEVLRSVRSFIKSSFDQVQCCLMPHPGSVVVPKTKKLGTSPPPPPFDGSWEKLDEDFVEVLRPTVESLLSEENLVLKKINGKELIGSEMREYIESYFKLFQSDSLPKALSIYEATVERQLELVLKQSLDFYKTKIHGVVDLIDKRNMLAVHGMSKEATFVFFTNENKMGNKQHEDAYKKKLEEGLQKLFSEWSDQAAKAQEKIQAEKAKTAQAIKEKEAADLEAAEAYKATLAKQAELEQQKQQQLIDKAEYEKQKAVLEGRVKFEKENAARIEAERRAAELHRQNVEMQLRIQNLESQRGPCPK